MKLCFSLSLSLSLSSSSPVESAEEEVPDAMFKESCITEQTQYFFDNDERSYAGVLDCGNCSRFISWIQNVVTVQHFTEFPPPFTRS